MLATSPTPPHLVQESARTATPPTYLSSSFPLPTHRYVGLLACQRDPLLTHLTTRVLRCEKRQPAPAPPASKGKKGKAPAVVEAQPDEWEVQLEDTVLFPEGGGQPSDTGTISELQDGTPIKEPATVREVLRRGLDAVHFVNRPLEVGAEVLVKLDVERRTDLMCQHTGQHLLSALLDRLSLPTLSWSLSPSPALNYIELPRAPSAAELSQLQNDCNAAIRGGAEVRVKMELAGEGGVELGEKVPTDYGDGEKGERKPVMRTVEIVGLDNGPCCGTHYPSLSPLGTLFVSPHTTPIRGTNARIYFCVGPRVLHYLHQMHSITRSTASEMGCSVGEVSERVGAMKLALGDMGKREKRIRDELAGFVAGEVWSEAVGASGAEGGVYAALSFREEDATNSLEFLAAVSTSLTARLAATPTVTRSLFILATACTPGSSTPAGGALLILGSEDLVLRAGKGVVEKFGARIKGGGKGRWQGKLAGSNWEAADRARLRRVLEEACVEV